MSETRRYERIEIELPVPAVHPGRGRAPLRGVLHVAEPRPRRPVRRLELPPACRGSSCSSSSRCPTGRSPSARGSPTRPARRPRRPHGHGDRVPRRRRARARDAAPLLHARALRRRSTTLFIEEFPHLKKTVPLRDVSLVLNLWEEWKIRNEGGPLSTASGAPPPPALGARATGRAPRGTRARPLAQRAAARRYALCSTMQKRPARAPLAHAPASLPGGGDGRVPPALGPAPRDPRLQRHGVDPGAPPGRPLHRELHAGPARAARGLRRRARARPVPRAHRAPAAELGPEERQAILRSFFMVDWERHVRPVPRYWELLQKRGRDVRDARRGAARGRVLATRSSPICRCSSTSPGWASARSPTTRGCARSRAKGRGYGARGRRLRARGAAPHPRRRSCRAGAARRARPGRALARRPTTTRSSRSSATPTRRAGRSRASRCRRASRTPRTRAGTCARRSRRTRAASARRPPGCGRRRGRSRRRRSRCSPREGVRWAASDEGVLLHSLPPSAPRLALALPPLARRGRRGGRARDALPRPLALRRRSASPTRSVPAQRGGRGLRRPRRRDRRRLGARSGTPGRPTVGVFLDGENAWEHYPEQRPRVPRPALRRARGERRGRDRDDVGGDAHAAAGPAIPRIHSGSWIEASYRIWIGHAEDRHAWTALGRARDAVAAAERAGAVDAGPARAGAAAPLRRRGVRLVLVVRRGLHDRARRRVRRAVPRPRHPRGAPRRRDTRRPRRSSPSSAPAARRRPASRRSRCASPTFLLTPALDGRETTFFEWQGSGLYRPGQHRGSMYGGAQAFHVLHYGFDLEALYLRLDPAESPARAAEVATHVRVVVLAADRQTDHRLPARPRRRASAPAGARPGEVGQAAFAQVLEIAHPVRRARARARG